MRFNVRLKLFRLHKSSFMKSKFNFALTILLCGFSAFAGNLIVKHNGTTVYSVDPAGVFTFVQDVREKSTVPVAAQGLKLCRSTENLLWTGGADKVNIKGQFIDPIAAKPLWMLFRHQGTGKWAALTDEGDIPVASTNAQYMVASDKYLGEHIIHNDIAIDGTITTKEYCNFDDGRIEFPIQSGIRVENKYFYIKDHRGSTRVTEKAVGASASVTEFVSYDAYGAVIRSQTSGTEDATKNKFTGKEYDTSGSIAGGVACGLKLHYFGARYYDPEIGIWITTDPEDQLFNLYGYSSNPLNAVDENGEWIGAVIGAVIGAYMGGVMSNIGGDGNPLNPGDWDWENPGTLLGVIQGAVSGGMLGNSIELSLRLNNSPFSDQNFRARADKAIDNLENSVEKMKFGADGKEITFYTEDAFQYYPKDANGKVITTDQGCYKVKSGGFSDSKQGGKIGIVPKKGIQGYVHSHLYTSKPSNVGGKGDIPSGIAHAKGLAKKTGAPVKLENYVVSKHGIGKYVVNSQGQLLYNNASYLPYSALSGNVQLGRNFGIFMGGSTGAFLLNRAFDK
jgi:RHS repeat-associated protein